MERSVTWKDICKWNPQRMKVLNQGVYDVLTSQALYINGGGDRGTKEEVGAEGRASDSRGGENQDSTGHCGNRAP